MKPTKKPKLNQAFLILALSILLCTGFFTLATAQPTQDPTPQPSVELKGLVDPPDLIEAVVDTVDDPEIKTDVFAMAPIQMDNATITLPKHGPVSAIFQCPDFDMAYFACPRWEQTNIPFTQTENTITFTVTHFSAYGGGYIEVIEAQHLDENYTLISNIYEEVRALDDIWSEPIYENEYIRATFEQPLDSSRDITLYARNTQGLSTTVEVYHQGTADKITEFPVITQEKYYKVYLTGMQGSHDTFDLKITNTDPETAYLEFDHIIDPTAPNQPTLNSPANASATTNNYQLLNFTVTDPDADSMTVELFGENSSTLSSEYLLYKEESVANGTTITYNWTAPMVRSDSDGLVLLMHFDNRSEYGENSTHVYDFSGMGNNGTIEGNAFINTTSPKLGDAMVGITGVAGDQVEVAHSASIQPSDALTVAAWVKFDSFPLFNGYDAHAIVHKGTGTGTGDAGQYYLHSTLSQVPVMRLIMYGNYYDAEGNTTFVADVWYHVVGTWDGSDIKIYVNGTLRGNKTYSGSLDTNTGSLKIGAVNSPENFEYVTNGSIDEVAVWNRSLSATEVLNLYQLKEQKYHWKVNASDTTGTNSSEAREFAVDSTSPSVTLNSPTEGSLKENPVTFNATVTDDGYVKNVTLYIDGVLNEANTSGTSGEYTFSKTLSSGEHNWSILAYDKAENSNQSSTLTFNVTSVDVSETLTPSTVAPSGNVSVSGHINVSHSGEDVADNVIGIYVDGTRYYYNDSNNILQSTPVWWDTDYKYRTNISIESSVSTSLNNTIALINFSTTGFVSDSKMNSNCSDVRFIDSDGNELAHTVETSTCNSSNTVFWIWGNLTGNANTTVYAYYGNSGADIKTDYTNPDDNLMLLMHFDNSSAYGESDALVYDFSKNGNNGSVSGAVVNTTDCKFGNCYTFDGDDDEVGLTNALNLGTLDFTFSAWINSETSSDVRVIFGNDPNAGGFGSNWMVFKSSTDIFQFYTVDSGGVTTVEGTTDIGGTGWHHVVAVRDGTSHKVYVDGNLDNSVTGTVRDITDTIIEGFSKETRTDWYHFNGQIDEVRIWNKSLSLDEILSIYNSTKIHHIENQTITTTDSSGDYNYTFTAPATEATYPVVVNTTYSGMVGNNSVDLVVSSVSNNAPTLDTFELYPASPGESDNLLLNATCSDADSGDTLTITWSVFKDGANQTSLAGSMAVTNGTETSVLTITSGNTSVGEVWNATGSCSDGTDTTATSATSNRTIGDTTNPTWDETPADQTAELGVAFSYDVNASDNVAIDTYWVNDTTNFAIDSSGVITNATGLSLGSYGLNISVNDTSGNVNNSIITVTVQDTTKPAVTINTPTSGWYNSNFIVNVTVTDSGTISSVKYRWENTTANGTWTSMTNPSGNDWNATFTISTVEDGNYTFRINATDNSDNSNDTVTVADVGIDTTKPAVSDPQSNVSTLKSGSGIRINITVTDTGGSGVESVSVKNGSVVSMTSIGSNVYETNTTPTALGCSSDGSCILTFNATDSAGNSNASVTLTITVDDGAPTIDFASPTTASGNQSQVYIEANITSTDSLAGLDTISLYLYNTTSLVQSNTSSSSPLFINFTGLSEGVYYLNATANDTLGNSNQTETRNITLDITYPSFSGHARSPDPPNQDEDVQVNVTLTETNLDAVLLEWNSSTNYTVTTKNGNEYYYTIDSGNYTNHATVTYKWHANDTAGNLNTSAEQSFTLANRPPTVGTPSLSSTTPDTDDTLTCTQGTYSDADSDSRTATYYKWYDSGVEITGQTSSTLDLSTSGLDKGDTIICSNMVSDGYDNSSWVNSSAATIQNSAPTISLDYPGEGLHTNKNGTTGNDLDFNFTYTDIDLDTGTCRLYINVSGSNPTDAYGSTSATSGSLENITMNNTLADGDYKWMINCTDGTATTQSTIRNLTMDTVAPAWAINSVSTDNTSGFNNQNVNLTLNDQCSDTNLYKCMVNVTNSTQTIWNRTEEDISTTTYTFTDEVDLSSLAEGTYTIEFSANDDHTFGSLRGLGHTIQSDGITFSKGTRSKKVYAGYYLNGDYHFLTRRQIKNYNVKFTAVERDGEYKYNLSFNRPPQDIKFGFAIPKADGLVVRDNSTGHFVWRNWYFDFEDLINHNFPITFLDTTNYYVIYTSTAYCDVAVGEKCVLDPVVGGLNTRTEYYEFQVDSTNPTVKSLDYPANGTTVTTTSTVDFNFTVTDNLAIKNCTLYDDLDGSWGPDTTITSVQNNTETNITVSPSSDGTFTWNVLCQDRAGNSDWFDSNYSVTIDKFTEISACDDTLDTDSKLAANISTDVTCFTINTNDVTLDCNGYWIMGNGSSATYYGVDTNTFNRTTLKNCNIKNITGISITTNSRDTTVEGNTFETDSGAADYTSLVRLWYRNNVGAVLVKDNTVTTAAKYSSLLHYTNTNSIGTINVTGNTITTSGYKAYGLSASGTASQMIFSDNTITTGTNMQMYGIYATVDNTTIDNNTITTGGTYDGDGININAFNATLTNNKINITGDQNEGVPIHFGYVTSSDNFNHTIDETNLVHGKPVKYYNGINNTIIEDNSSWGMLIVANSNNVTIDNVTIKDAGIVSLYATENSKVINSNISNSRGSGIFLHLGSSDNVIENNTITQDQSKAGIWIRYNSDDNNITANTISGRGAGIFLDGHASYVLDGNILKNNDITSLSNQQPGAMGISVSRGNSNTLLNNTINISTNNAYGGIRLSASTSNNITNNTVLTYGSQNGQGLWLSGGSQNNTFSGNSITTSHGNAAYGLQLLNDVSGNTFTNDVFTIPNDEDVYFQGGSTGTITFTNVTFNKHDVAFQNSNANGTLNTSWYVIGEVKDQDGSAINEANVSVYDVNSNLLDYDLTDASGLTKTFTMQDYKMNRSETIYYTPHAVNATKTYYQDNSTIVNLTETNSTTASITLTNPAPTWSGNKTNASNSIKTGQSAYFNITWADDNPGKYIFSLFNGTDWVNDSAASWTDGVELEIIKTISATRGQTVQWYWWANDTIGRSNQTDTWSFTVADTGPTTPTLGAISPSPAYKTSNLSASASGSTDADGDTITYYYLWNTSAGATLNDWSPQNYFDCDSDTNCNKSVTVYVYAKAVTADTNSSITSQSTSITNTAPTLPSLSSPGNGSNTQDTTPTFTWTVSTDADGDSITYGIEIDDNSDFSSITQSNYSLTDNNYTAAELSEATYYWRVKAITSDANSSYTGYYTLVIDTSAPGSINFVSPTPGDNANLSQDYYYVNVTFTEANPDVCLFDNTTTNMTMTRVGTDYCYLNRTSISDGTYQYRVWVNNTVGLWGSSGTLRAVTLDTVNPAVTLNAPANETTKNESTVTFNATVSDTHLKNLTLYINGTANQTNSSGTSGEYIFNVTFANANYSWYILAYDFAGNSNQSAIRTLTVDAGPSCGTTLTEDTTLRENLTSAGTCFTLGADDIIIDGAGFGITGNKSGHGINITGYDNITIKNFAAIENFTNNIYGEGATNSTIFNNTINKIEVAAVTTGYGIYLISSSNNNNISSNTIVTTVSDPGGTSGMGIYLGYSDSNTVESNVINTSKSKSQGLGIQLSASDSNNITSNTIYTFNSGANDYAHGIAVSSSSNNRANSNDITTAGEWSYGIYVYSSSNSTTVDSNTITTTNIAGYGVYTKNSNLGTITSNTISTASIGGFGVYNDNSNSTNISSNVINTSGNTAYGVHIRVSSTNTAVTSNTINTSGPNAYAVYLYNNADSNRVTSNTITTSGTTGIGIRLEDGSDSNNLTSNTITTSGDDGYGVYIDPSNSNLVSNNVTTTGTGAYALYLYDGENNTATNGSLSAENADDVRINNGNLTLTNVTYTDVGFDVGSTSSLTEKEILNVTATDTFGNSLSGANLTIYNLGGSYLTSALTGSNGAIASQTLTEFIQDATGITYHTPHSVNATMSGYQRNSTTANLTEVGGESVIIKLPPAFSDCHQYDGNQSQCEKAGCYWEQDTLLCNPNADAMDCDQFCTACYTDAECQASSDSCIWDSNYTYCYNNFTEFYETGTCLGQQPIDCASQPHLCDSRFDMDRGFYGFETLCSDAVDNDVDGLTDCSDPDCTTWDFCSGYYDMGADTDCPIITDYNVHTDKESAEIDWSTTEPANATIEFYGPDSSCGTSTLNISETDAPACSLDDYMTHHHISLDSLAGLNLMPDNTYYYKISGYDRAGLRYDTICLNFTTKANYQEYYMRFHYEPTYGMEMDFGGGFSDYDFTTTSQQFNRSRNVRMRFKGAGITFGGVDIGMGKSINYTGRFKSGISSEFGKRFVGMDSATWLESMQSLGMSGADNITMTMEAVGKRIYKCDDTGANCREMTECVETVSENKTHTTISVLAAAGFSAYVVGDNAQMWIWDQTDNASFYDGNQTKYSTNQITFYANYTNLTTGEIINGSNVYCEMRFNETGSWVNHGNMRFNSSIRLYHYNRSYNTYGTYYWNALCNGSAQGFDELNATDDNVINVTHDTINPALTPVSLPTGWHNSDFGLNVSANDAESGLENVQYRWENTSQNNTWQNMSNPSGSQWNTGFDITSVADGNYTIRINASDHDANANTTSTSLGIDDTAPISNATDISGWHSIDFAVESNSTDATSGVNNVTYKFENSIWNGSWQSLTQAGNTWSTTLSITELEDGIYNITIKTTDSAGNENTTAFTNIGIDDAEPILNLISNITGWKNSDFDINSNSTDATSGVNNVTYRFENSTWTGSWASMTRSGNDWDTSFNITTVEDGNYNVSLKSDDLAGNTKLVVTSVSIDDTDPFGSIISQIQGWHNSNFDINISANDTTSGVNFVYYRWTNSTQNGTWYELDQDGSLWNKIFSITGVEDGNYSIWMRIIDTAGNQNITEQVSDVGVDDTNPSLNTTNITKAAIVPGEVVTISANASDLTSGVTSVITRIQMASNQSYIENLTLSGTTEYSSTFNSSAKPTGIYFMDLAITDSAGNGMEEDDYDAFVISPYATGLHHSRSSQFASNVTRVINSTNETNTVLEVVSSETTASTLTVAEYNGTDYTASVSEKTALGKYMDVETKDVLRNNLTNATIRFYYTDQDVSNLGLDETSLKLYRYNTSTDSWVLLSSTSVNTTHNYVWAVVSNFSFFGIFGGEEEEEETPSPPTQTDGGGGAAVTTVTAVPKENITMSTELIKERVKQGDYKDNVFTITNDGDEKVSVDLSAGLTELVALSDPGFELGPGETRAVNLRIMADETTAPGVYTGKVTIKAGSLTKTISLIIEIITKRVLFDVKIDIPSEYREIMPGNDLKSQISVINLGDLKGVDIFVRYRIKDLENNILLEDTETFAIYNETSFAKNIYIPSDFEHGEYVALTEVVFRDTVTTSSQMFRVGEKGLFIGVDNLIYYITILAVMLAIVIIALLAYTRKQIKLWKWMGYG